MRLTWIILALLAQYQCNQPPPQPKTAQQVWLDLVNAGCVMDDDAGVFALEHDSNRPDEPVWMKCMFAGGTVKSCGVPCGP